MMPAMSESTATPAVASISVSTLFLGFLKVGLSGFGGVMPFARRMIVEQRRWLDEEEFLDVVSLSQFLPGPNIVNVSIIIGRRFQGLAGSFAACGGLMLLPLAIVLALATLYAQYAQVDAVRGACSGVSASASGLILATALKLARPIRESAWQAGICVVVFVGIALLRIPLLWMLAVFCPLAIGIAWRTRG
jgi:chromate transporter